MEEKNLYPVSSHEHSEEKFVLASGLNDILIAIGIGLIFLGIFIRATLVPSFMSLERAFWTSLFYGIIGLGLSWGLSEYLTVRRTFVLPSIVLAVSVTIFSYVVGVMVFSPWPGNEFLEVIAKLENIANRITWSNIVAIDKAKIMTIMLCPIAVLCAYYWRFRLPFTLFMIGATGTLGALMFFALFFKDFLRVDVLFLIAGGLIFLWAMRFDVKDPERQTRFSDCAFWLHLLAAPLFVGSLTHMVVPDFSAMTSKNAGVVALLFFVLGLVSLMIDRRSLFMAGLVALWRAIAYAVKMFMNHAQFDEAALFCITMLILGCFVLFLGLGWVPVRRLLLKFCVPDRLAVRLRPVEPVEEENASQPLS